MAFAGRAQAGEVSKEECVAANEEASVLRREDKLLEARADLLRCRVEECPRPVREDCIEQLREVEELLPTIFFRIRDTRDAAIPGVRLTVDGTPVADLPRNEPLPLDPGDHVFAFTADGYRGVTTRLLILRRDKDRIKEVQLEPLPQPTRAFEHPGRAVAGQDVRSSAAWVLAGGSVAVGVVATSLGLLAKTTYDDAVARSCPRGLDSCSQPGVDGVASAHQQAGAATALFIVAGGLLVGAVTLWLTAPSAR